MMERSKVPSQRKAHRKVMLIHSSTSTGTNLPKMLLNSRFRIHYTGVSHVGNLQPWLESLERAVKPDHWIPRSPVVWICCSVLPNVFLFAALVRLELPHELGQKACPCTNTGLSEWGTYDEPVGRVYLVSAYACGRPPRRTSYPTSNTSQTASHVCWQALALCHCRVEPTLLVTGVVQ